ncbi:hypothetical protein M5K25_010260 [Dendrobium thyrsiflorum]|uniref:Uncharacterized protein n=1 Tax=Dendrobium thyrsiflorum TaxID=117978 RepID=A0ABD0V6L2_DENTH
MGSLTPLSGEEFQKARGKIIRMKRIALFKIRARLGLTGQTVGWPPDGRGHVPKVTIKPWKSVGKKLSEAPIKMLIAQEWTRAFESKETSPGVVAKLIGLNLPKTIGCQKKEDQRKKEEKDERKRKYNVKWSDEGDMQVTAEDMDAYRLKRIHHDDPMKDFLH